MKILIIKFLLITFTLSSFVFATQVDNKARQLEYVKTIRDRMETWAVTQRIRGDKPWKSVSEYLELLNSDGSFKDKSPSPAIMNGRLLLMAQAFKNDSKWKGNVHLKTNLYSAIQYWLDHNPGNGGWTAGCFAEPAAMDSIGLCLYDAIQQDKISHPEMTPKLDTLVTGMVEWANYVWTQNTNGEFFAHANISYRLRGMIGRAALANSPEMFNDITNIVDSTFAIGKLYDSGRFADGSWHQHNSSGGQNYWIGYGCDWLYLTRKSCAFLKGTPWALTTNQLNTLANSILDGWQQFIYRNQGVYSVGGRHNLIKNALRDNSFLVGQIDLLQQLAGEGVLIRNNELEETKYRLTHTSIKYPSFNANKYFYKSDLMIHARPFHYVAVKMLSNRTAGPESGSGLAKLNYHFGEGSTMIFRTGDEYQNARVGWNFRAVPGTTIEQKTNALPNVDYGLNGKSFNAFAGGISDSNSNFGLCGFQLHRANCYSKVTANKGYFFFNNGFLALGSAIRKHPPYQGFEIWTTIDQPERKSDITYFINGEQQTIALASNVQIDFTNVTKGAWFYCNNKGYIILPNKNGIDLKLWAEKRTGDWNNLDARHSPGDIQTVNIFQLSINHHTKPRYAKYAYIVLPDINKEEVENYFRKAPVKILRNSTSVQAVQFCDSNITGIIFYKAGKIAAKSSFIKGGMGDLTISVDKPAIVMLHRAGSKLNISVSDPTQYCEEIIITINKKLKGGENIIYNPETRESKITFSLPQGIYLGKTVEQEFTITNQ
ncbi:MAG: hypothetical protein DRI44_02420 [Chlamydiae bacterium]|nr:MAG: hypothetical protein DRI44_02420 [Chlamydiota bacterium]